MNPLEEWLTEPDGVADRLRALRTQAGLSGNDLAESLGWAASKVSRLENGRQMPSPADIAAWASACGAEEAGHALVSMLEEVQTLHRAFKRRVRRGHAAIQASILQEYEQCRLMRSFTTAFVPGALQTADYARCVFTEMAELHGSEVDDAEASVTLRLRRQQYLYDSGKQFEFILAEPVLLWRTYPDDVMLGQLDRLQTVIGVPNIRFGIIPINEPIRTTLQNSFSIFDDVAYVETFVGESGHRGEEAAAYSRVMDRLWDDAVTGEGARRLILRAADRLRDEA